MKYFYSTSTWVRIGLQKTEEAILAHILRSYQQLIFSALSSFFSQHFPSAEAQSDLSSPPEDPVFSVNCGELRQRAEEPMCGSIKSRYEFNLWWKK